MDVMVTVLLPKLAQVNVEGDQVTVGVPQLSVVLNITWLKGSVAVPFEDKFKTT
jgi:hypothetical protein